jgi:hypothetical protein
MSELSEPAMAEELIDPIFYSVLKQWGFSVARDEHGDYLDERSQAAWDAYRCGRLQVMAEAPELRSHRWDDA